MTDSKNLCQKILDITDEIGKLEKTGKNTQQGYAFIEQAQVVATIKPLLIKHGVLIVPATVSRTMERYQNAKGTDAVHANVVSRYVVINADNPDERIECDWDAGEAIDYSDKATNKAVTASNKTFLMKLFNISDKDDADADSPEPSGQSNRTPQASPNKPASPAQKNFILKLYIEQGGDPDMIVDYLKGEGYDTDTMTSADASKIIEKLQGGK